MSDITLNTFLSSKFDATDLALTVEEIGAQETQSAQSKNKVEPGQKPLTERVIKQIKPDGDLAAQNAEMRKTLADVCQKFMSERKVNASDMKSVMDAVRKRLGVDVEDSEASKTVLTPLEARRIATYVRAQTNVTAELLDDAVSAADLPKMVKDALVTFMKEQANHPDVLNFLDTYQNGERNIDHLSRVAALLVQTKGAELDDYTRNFLTGFACGLKPTADISDATKTSLDTVPPESPKDEEIQKNGQDASERTRVDDAKRAVKDYVRILVENGVTRFEKLLGSYDVSKLTDRFCRALNDIADKIKDHEDALKNPDDEAHKDNNHLSVVKQLKDEMDGVYTRYAGWIDKQYKELSTHFANQNENKVLALKEEFVKHLQDEDVKVGDNILDRFIKNPQEMNANQETQKEENRKEDTTGQMGNALGNPSAQNEETANQGGTQKDEVYLHVFDSQDAGVTLKDNSIWDVRFSALAPAYGTIEENLLDALEELKLPHDDVQHLQQHFRLKLKLILRPDLNGDKWKLDERFTKLVNDKAVEIKNTILTWVKNQERVLDLAPGMLYTALDHEQLANLKGELDAIRKEVYDKSDNIGQPNFTQDLLKMRVDDLRKKGGLSIAVKVQGALSDYRDEKMKSFNDFLATTPFGMLEENGQERLRLFTPFLILAEEPKNVYGSQEKIQNASNKILDDGKSTSEKAIETGKQQIAARFEVYKAWLNEQLQVLATKVDEVKQQRAEKNRESKENATNEIDKVETEVLKAFCTKLPLAEDKKPLFEKTSIEDEKGVVTAQDNVAEQYKNLMADVLKDFGTNLEPRLGKNQIAALKQNLMDKLVSLRTDLAKAFEKPLKHFKSVEVVKLFDELIKPSLTKLIESGTADETTVRLAADQLKDPPNDLGVDMRARNHILGQIQNEVSTFKAWLEKQNKALSAYSDAFRKDNPATTEENLAKITKELGNVRESFLKSAYTKEGYQSCSFEAFIKDYVPGKNDTNKEIKLNVEADQEPVDQEPVNKDKTEFGAQDEEKIDPLKQQEKGKNLDTQEKNEAKIVTHVLNGPNATMANKNVQNKVNDVQNVEGPEQNQNNRRVETRDDFVNRMAGGSDRESVGEAFVVSDTNGFILVHDAATKAPDAARRLCGLVYDFMQSESFSQFELEGYGKTFATLEEDFKANLMQTFCRSLVQDGTKLGKGDDREKNLLEAFSAKTKLEKYQALLEHQNKGDTDRLVVLGDRFKEILKASYEALLVPVRRKELLDGLKNIEAPERDKAVEEVSQWLQNVPDSDLISCITQNIKHELNAPLNKNQVSQFLNERIDSSHSRIQRQESINSLKDGILNNKADGVTIAQDARNNEEVESNLVKGLNVLVDLVALSGFKELEVFTGLLGNVSFDEMDGSLKQKFITQYAKTLFKTQQSVKRWVEDASSGNKNEHQGTNLDAQKLLTTLTGINDKRISDVITDSFNEVAKEYVTELVLKNYQPQEEGVEEVTQDNIRNIMATMSLGDLQKLVPGYNLLKLDNAGITRLRDSLVTKVLLKDIPEKAPVKQNATVKPGGPNTTDDIKAITNTTVYTETQNQKTSAVLSFVNGLLATEKGIVSFKDHVQESGTDDKFKISLNVLGEVKDVTFGGPSNRDGHKAFDQALKDEYNNTLEKDGNSDIINNTDMLMPDNTAEIFGYKPTGDLVLKDAGLVSVQKNALVAQIAGTLKAEGVCVMFQGSMTSEEGKENPVTGQYSAITNIRMDGNKVILQMRNSSATKTEDAIVEKDLDSLLATLKEKNNEIGENGHVDGFKFYFYTQGGQYDKKVLNDNVKNVITDNNVKDSNSAREEAYEASVQAALEESFIQANRKILEATVDVLWKGYSESERSRLGAQGMSSEGKEKNPQFKNLSSYIQSQFKVTIPHEFYQLLVNHQVTEFQPETKGVLRKTTSIKVTPGLKNAFAEYVELVAPRVLGYYGEKPGEIIEGKNRKKDTNKEFVPGIERDDQLKKDRIFGQKNNSCFMMNLVNGLCVTENGTNYLRKLAFVNHKDKKGMVVCSFFSPKGTLTKYDICQTHMENENRKLDEWITTKYENYDHFTSAFFEAYLEHANVANEKTEPYAFGNVVFAAKALGYKPCDMKIKNAFSFKTEKKEHVESFDAIWSEAAFHLSQHHLCTLHCTWKGASHDVSIARAYVDKEGTKRIEIRDSQNGGQLLDYDMNDFVNKFMFKGTGNRKTMQADAQLFAFELDEHGKNFMEQVNKDAEQRKKAKSKNV